MNLIFSDVNMLKHFSLETIIEFQEESGLHFMMPYAILADCTIRESVNRYENANAIELASLDSERLDEVNYLLYKGWQNKRMSYAECEEIVIAYTKESTIMITDNPIKSYVASYFRIISKPESFLVDAMNEFILKKHRGEVIWQIEMMEYGKSRIFNLNSPSTTLSTTSMFNCNLK